MRAHLTVWLGLCLPLAGCMTHLNVTTSVYDGPLEVSDLDVSDFASRLEGAFDGMAALAEQGFRAKVLPVSSAFDPLFSGAALDPVVFGRFVERSLRDETAAAREAIRHDLTSLKVALERGSRARAAQALQELSEGLDRLEDRVRTRLDALVQMRVSDDAQAIVDEFSAARPLLRELLGSLAAGERPSVTAHAVAQAERARLDPDDEPAETTAVLAAARRRLACLWRHAFQIEVGGVGPSPAGQSLRGAVGDVWDQAARAQANGRRFDEQHLEQAYLRLAELPAAVAEQAGIVATVVGEAVVASVEEQRDVLLQTLDLGDPLIAQIVGDRRNWKRYVNEVDVWTVIGNSEVAIKMENLGEYHIKGVVIDNDAAAAATFDVLEQSVKALAAAYGAPVTTSRQDQQDGAQQSDEASTALSQPDLRAEVVAIEGRVDARAARLDQAFRALLAFAGELPAAVDGQDQAAYLEDLVNRRDRLVSRLVQRAQDLREAR